MTEDTTENFEKSFLIPFVAILAACVLFGFVSQVHASGGSDMSTNMHWRMLN